MAISTTIPLLSPNAFQLRLRSFNRQQSSLLISSSSSRIHLRRFNHHRIRIRMCVSSTQRDGYDEGERKEKPGNSWMNSDTSNDSTAGWSSGGDSNVNQQQPPKKSFGGLVRAGVVGVIVAAALGFAAFSLSKRNASGPKQHIQMQPVSAQVQMLETWDDQEDKVDHVSSEDSSVRPDDRKTQSDSSNPESMTGINKVSSTSPEITEATSESGKNDNVSLGTSLVATAGNSSSSIDDTTNVSSQEDLQVRSDPDDISVPSESNTSLPRITEGVESHLDAGTQESIIEPKEKPTVDLDVPFVLDDNSANLDSVPQEGISISRGMEHSKLPLDVSSDSVSQNSSGSFVDNLVNSESGSILETHVVPEDAMDTLALLSSKEDLILSETAQILREGKLPLERDILTENVSLGETPASVVADQISNDPGTNRETDKSSSLFELSMTEDRFSSAGIPAPSLVSAALQVPPGKVLIPGVVDQAQGQALAALQVLKVIEADVQSTDLCTRREYARWLVSASSILSRNSVSKVYPAMYIENVTDLAFDDITPEDPDFSSIQGLAEAGLIASKLSRSDMLQSSDGEQDPLYFSPESPVSRQDLVSWKLASDKRQLPEVGRELMQSVCGFIDIDKINPDAWPALVADLSAGDQGITALAFGYTRLFQPDKPVTKAQAAIALATSDAADIVSEELARIEAESMAETAVAAHTALVAQVEKDVNASFEKELSLEREKIDAIEKLAEEAKLELEKLRAEKTEENNSLMRAQATVESEMEVLTRLRRDLEEQLQSIMTDRAEISFEKERIDKLMKQAESGHKHITQLQYELEVERKALSMARSWAEDEAKKAREHAKALEEARDRWKKHGIKVVVDSDLQDDENAGLTWNNAAAKQDTVDESVNKAESLVEKLKEMSEKIKGKSRDVIDDRIQKINSIIVFLKECAAEASKRAQELQAVVSSKASESLKELKRSANGFSVAVKEGATRIAGDCKEGVEKLTQKFKT